MRILLLAHSFNSLTQRCHVELVAAGHDVSIEFDINDRVTEEAVALHRPDVVVAPFLKRAIPQSVWRNHRCIVIHPGIRGDRGPSALDWAILDGEREWGVTALQPTGEMDAGPVYASVEFPMRAATKASLYRNEVTNAAVTALEMALARIRDGVTPAPLDPQDSNVRGRWRPSMRQQDRAIDWRVDDTATILRKIRAADSFPGVRDEIAGIAVHLFDAHREGSLSGPLPGSVIATRAGAICRATIDGAVWITHLQRVANGEPTFKLPATMALRGAIAHVPDVPIAATERVNHTTWQPIRYEERGAVGYLHFPFYNGAMGTAQCEALAAAYRTARARPTRVIVLAGGPDFWSNGIHLNLIEASAHPAEESWRNINAMNDLAREILMTDDKITVAALAGNAGAGGVFLALGADRVWARDGVILNPHYKGMGNLYGSEYWSYVLPRRVAGAPAAAVTENRLPVSARQAKALGLIDAHFGADLTAFEAEVAARAEALAAEPECSRFVAAKRVRRRADEASKPLERYRSEELEHMKQNFFGFDPSYHVARYNFVFKVPRSRTPLWLAQHRRGTKATQP